MVKTDADGKFSINIPRGEYTIKAQASRKTYNDTEFYDWDFPMTFYEAKTQMFLSDDNVTNR